jgi:hypothetical protein
MWRNRFGGDFEPVVRQNTEGMNADNGCARTFTISFIVVVVTVTFDKAG